MWSWPFDLIIFGFLILVGAFLIEVVTDWGRYRRRPFVLGFVAVLVVGWITIFYGSFIEPQRLVIREQEIRLGDGDEQMNVALVADFHVGPYKQEKWVSFVVHQLNALNPDLILIAGDFIFNHPDDVLYLDPLQDLDAPQGIWAVTGNHDYTLNAQDVVVNKLESLGVEVLENEAIILTSGGDSLTVVGISDLWFAADVDAALQTIDEEENVLLLSHNPDVVMDARVQKLVDLVASGHTHGGQIRLPFIGAVPPLPTDLGRAYDQGLFFYDNVQLFITSGLGETGPRARLFNPPEIYSILLTF